MSVTTVTEELPLRRLEEGDYYKGFLELLGQLTTVGPITFANFQAQFKKVPEVYVIEDGGRIVATGTLMLEPKFIHNCGTVGHIEDVVVDSKYRGRHLGIKIINHLVEVAKTCGCYKVILDCAEFNVPFYEKCGFVIKEIEMARYF